MKYYNKILKGNLTYKEALEEMCKNAIATRPEWDGVHMFRDGNYYIILKDGAVLINPTTVMDEDKLDWIIVVPNEECIKIMGRMNVFTKQELQAIENIY